MLEGRSICSAHLLLVYVLETAYTMGPLRDNRGLVREFCAAVVSNSSMAMVQCKLRGMWQRNGNFWYDDLGITIRCTQNSQARVHRCTPQRVVTVACRIFGANSGFLSLFYGSTTELPCFFPAGQGCRKGQGGLRNRHW